MNNIKNIDTLKSKLKELAKAISKAKPQRKTVHYTGMRTMTSKQAETLCCQSKYTFRHMHIAYCELRGRTREQIEPKNKLGKESLNDHWIEDIKLKYAWPVEVEIQEAV